MQNEFLPSRRHGATDESSQSLVLTIAAAVIVDGERLLLVRKRGSPYFMQAGGKIEPGESAQAAVAREVFEELGVPLAGCEPLGQASATAANEAGHRVDAHLFWGCLSGEPTPAAEIEELRWVTLTEAGALPLAALTRDTILPIVAEHLVAEHLVAEHSPLSD
ncbi:NUDIX hydrolase [Salinicola aestuarinus]|uniref:NUDIX hydrolase n=1 Tax=Salinicola aestuarinus TaxID=1949082 RepID=UPI000DA23988|nr:NUDIX domain-containing protein [Salinicola aestuarinus]